MPRQSIHLLSDCVAYSFSKHLSHLCVTLFEIEPFEFHFLNLLYLTSDDAHERKYICGNEIIRWLFFGTREIKTVQVTWEVKVKGQLRGSKWPPEIKEECLKGNLHNEANDQFCVLLFSHHSRRVL